MPLGSHALIVRGDLTYVCTRGLWYPRIYSSQVPLGSHALIVRGDLTYVQKNTYNNKLWKAVRCPIIMQFLDLIVLELT